VVAVKWFDRRKRFSLGTFVAPPVRDVTIDEMVDDGVLIASAAVSLAVKNLLILSSMRDHIDYSAERAGAVVRAELVALIAEKEEDAARLSREAAEAARRDGRASRHDDYRAVDSEPLARRAEVSGRLAERLRELSDDEPFTAGLAERARTDAWGEIGASIAARASRATVVRDPDYDRERGDRMLQLLGDLADLADLADEGASRPGNGLGLEL
jgi:hypothetical protein